MPAIRNLKGEPIPTQPAPVMPPPASILARPTAPELPQDTAALLLTIKGEAAQIQALCASLSEHVTTLVQTAASADADWQSQVDRLVTLAEGLKARR